MARRKLTPAFRPLNQADYDQAVRRQTACATAMPDAGAKRDCYRSLAQHIRTRVYFAHGGSKKIRSKLEAIEKVAEKRGGG